MKTRWYVPVLLCACLLLCGCGNSRERQAYAAICNAYDGEASWTLNGRDYAGHISIGKRDETGERGAVIVYTSPAALCGMTVRAEGQDALLSLGNVTHRLTGEAAEEALAIVCLFSPKVAEEAVWTKEGLVHTEQDSTYTARFDDEGRICELGFSSPARTISLRPGGGA